MAFWGQPEHVGQAMKTLFRKRLAAIGGPELPGAALVVLALLAVVAVALTIPVLLHPM